MVVALLVVLAVAPAPSIAKTIMVSGAAFQTDLMLDGEQPMSLAGSGVAKYKVVFTVYAAGFYVPSGIAANAIMDDDTARRLEIEYFYDIDASDIVAASTQTLEEQLSEKELATLHDRLAKWHDAYESVSEGDRYAMTYRPGKGTTLTFNGVDVITVPGADFARAYFGIWLGDPPLSDDLKTALLSRL